MTRPTNNKHPPCFDRIAHEKKQQLFFAVRDKHHTITTKDNNINSNTKSQPPRRTSFCSVQLLVTIFSLSNLVVDARIGSRNGNATRHTDHANANANAETETETSRLLHPTPHSNQSEGILLGRSSTVAGNETIDTTQDGDDNDDDNDDDDTDTDTETHNIQINLDHEKNIVI
eukprot:jgi/Psemu1/18653/gm1.18653_g